MVVRADSTSIAVLAGLAVLFGSAEVVADVSGQTEVASIVEPDGLEAAYGRLTSGQLAAEALIGPALAGTALQWSPTVAAIGAVVSFAVAGLAIGPGRSRPPTTRRPGRWWSEAFAGVQLLTSHRWLRRAAATAGVLNFTSAASAAVLVTYAVDADGLALSERSFGFLLTAMGVGGVVGGIVAPRVHALVGDQRSLMIGAAGFVFVDVVPGVLVEPAVLAAASALGVAVGMIYATKVISIRQRVLDDEIRGRVNAASQLIGAETAPIGAIAGGLLATGVGSRPTFIALGAVAICGVLAAHPWSGIPVARRDARAGSRTARSGR